MRRSSPTPYLIQVFRCSRLVFHFAWIGLISLLGIPFIGEKRKAQLKQRWALQVLNILCIRLEKESTNAPMGCLIICNHISWLDIFAINALRPAAFVAKAEIRTWPFIGWLSAKHGTVFLRRGSRGHARIVNTEIDSLLNCGKDVAVFPEGMTTDGTHLLGFHAALLQPAVETGRPVLPLALSYLDAQGELSLAPSFAGETTLMKSFLTILACRALCVSLIPLPMIETPGKTRREISKAAHTAIATTLATKSGFHPVRNSLEKLHDLQA